MTLKEVLQKFRIGKTTWYAGVQIGIYPKPIRVGKRTVVWSHAAVVESILSLN